MKTYLAIYYGVEGWSLTPYDTASKAIGAVMAGETHGYKWKILRELEVKIIEEEVKEDG